MRVIESLGPGIQLSVLVGELPLGALVPPRPLSSLPELKSLYYTVFNGHSGNSCCID